MKLYFDRQAVASCDDLLSLYKASEFESPTRSTVPLFSLVKYGGEIWSSISQNCSEAHFEFCVEPVQGRGMPSHTDVMLKDGLRSVALEAKWTEPRYDAVRAWLRRGSNTENRLAVLAGWLKLLQPQATKPLELDAFEGTIYQMVHRAASACASGSKPALSYVQFSPLPDGTRPGCLQVLDDLTHLHEVLGRPEGFSFRLLEVIARPTAAFDEIRNLGKASLQTAESVKQALRGEALFVFDEVREYPGISP